MAVALDVQVHNPIPYPLNAIAESVGCVAASSENLRLAVERRKTSGQKPIFVAPDPGSWGTFRKSAFRATSDVTPVVVAYSPELNWEILGGRSFGEAIWNFLLKSTRTPYYYGLKQLPTVSRGPSEDPAEFARRTQLRMDEAREHLAKKLNDGLSGGGVLARLPRVVASDDHVLLDVFRSRVVRVRKRRRTSWNDDSGNRERRLSFNRKRNGDARGRRASEFDGARVLPLGDLRERELDSGDPGIVFGRALRLGGVHGTRTCALPSPSGLDRPLSLPRIAGSQTPALFAAFFSS